MPEFDKEDQKEQFKQVLVENQDVFLSMFKEYLHDPEVFEWAKKVLFAVLEQILDYCGRWALKSIATAALIGIIYLGLVGQGWKK